MANSIGRSLTVAVKADTKDFKRGMQKSETALQSFGRSMKVGAKIGIAAFSALGVAAVAFGASAAKAAAEDEASQKKLAQALKNTTNASDKQIASTEKWITKTQLAYGISDSKLRPAYQKLVTATGDLDRAQTLTNLAMDIAAGTGKDLEAISLALAKAHNGNVGALTRLGISLDKNIIETNDFEAATAVLSKTFAGQAAVAADTYQGKLNRLNEGWGEFKEGIGEAALPALTRFVDYSNNTFLPLLGAIGRGFAGKTDESVSNKVKQLSRDLEGKTTGESLGESLRSVADAFGRLFASLTSAESGQATSTLQRIADSLETVANGIDSITNALNKAKPVWKFLKDIGEINLLKLGESDGQKIVDLFKGRATGGMVNAGQPYLVGERGAEIFVPSGSGSIVPNQRLAAGAGVTYNITMNGIVDSESARRSIERVLQDSSRRTGAVAVNGAFV